MKKIIAATVVALAVCLAASCSGPAGGAATLYYGSGDYTAINPALYEHGEINLLLFAGLTAHDSGSNAVPALAESWEYDEASLTYTFVLREGLTFHDGAPLTSADVKFTIESIMNPENGSENESNFEEVESVFTPNERTIVIALNAPSAALPDYLAVGILPKHLLEGQDMAFSNFNRNPVGAGPYKLADWDMGQSITMEAFDNFYLGRPNIDRVVFKIVEDYSVRALQMRAGELTLAQIPPRDSAEFRDSADFVVYDMDTADYRGILYNFNNPFWKSNPGLPAALSFAIDRGAVVRSVLLGRGQEAWSPIQKGSYVNDAIEKYAYDPLRAKEAVEELGWRIASDGCYAKDGVRLAFPISVRATDPVRVDMARIAAQNLQDIGVDCTVDIVSRTDWAGQYAYLIGWGSPFDPDDHTYKVFGTGQGANYSGYANAEVDRLLLEARSTPDRERRLALYREFQEALSKDPAYTFIAYIDAVYVAQPGLKGIAAETTLGHHGVGIFWNVHEWILE